MSTRNCAAVLLLGFAASCDVRTTTDRIESRHAMPVRRITAMPAETLWVRGGRKDDRVLRYPEYLAHDSTQVYVSDMAANALVAIDQRTGATNWTTANTPGVLRAPAGLAGLPGGGVAVLDAAGTLVRIDRRGRMTSSASLIDGNIARQICAFDDSTFLIAYMRQRLPLAIVDAAGQIQKQLELPWDNLREMAPMQTQMLLAGASANRCIVSLAFGQGLAALRKDSVEWLAPYVETVAIPGVNAKTSSSGGTANTVSHIAARHVAVRDLSVDGDAIEVIFEGASLQPGSLVDEYQASTGAYRATRLASRRVVGIQKSGERAFFLAGLNGYPALVAIRMSDQPK